MPYETMPYIQRGGGIFNTIADVARRFIMPEISRGTKLAAQLGTRALKSKAASNIIDSAKTAVKDGLVHAANQVVAGEHPGKAVQSGANKTAATISSTLKQEAQKVGKQLKRKLTTIDEPNVKKKKKSVPAFKATSKAKPVQKIKKSKKSLKSLI